MKSIVSKYDVVKYDECDNPYMSQEKYEKQDFDVETYNSKEFFEYVHNDA